MGKSGALGVWLSSVQSWESGISALLKLLIYEELQQMWQLFCFLVCNCSYLAAELSPMLLYENEKWSYCSI